MQGFLKMWGPATGLGREKCRFSTFKSLYRISRSLYSLTSYIYIYIMLACVHRYSALFYYLSETGIVFRGGFRHVQHVRPNRGPTKMGPPHEDQKCLVLSCPWKRNDNTKLLPPDAFSVLWMVPKCLYCRGSAPKLSGLRPEPRWGSLQRSPGPLAGVEGARCLSPRVSRILSIVNEMTTLCVSVKAVATKLYCELWVVAVGLLLH